jgi:8-hydroxy-5-deazaflavin:NADPH oxidoreductase
VPQADVSLLKKVANLLDQFEFDVVDTGPLEEGRRFQKQPTYGVPLESKKLREARAAAYNLTAAP